ncbi:MAG: hypothetical protein U0V73_12060 [Acidimicrobiia bacterium]
MPDRVLPLLLLSLLLGACGSAQASRSTVTTVHSASPTGCPGGGPLPEPTGGHAVGTAALPAPAELGHLTAFYPTADCTGPRPQYLRAELADALGLDRSALDPIVVHAGSGATPLGGVARPVVVLTPGWTSLVALSTSLATDLASHGYVVVTDDPPLGTETTTFPDVDAAARRLRVLRGILDLLDDPTVEGVTGPLDRSHIAAGGHSYAGSVAFQLAQDDERLTAVFDLDGVIHGAGLAAPMRVPALIVATTGGSATDPSLAHVLGQSPHAVGIVLQRADHYDLTDVPALVTPLGALTASLAHGTIGVDAIGITNHLVRGFLDCVTSPAAHPCLPTAETLTAGLPDAAPLSVRDTRA